MALKILIKGLTRIAFDYDDQWWVWLQIEVHDRNRQVIVTTQVTCETPEPRSPQVTLPQRQCDDYEERFQGSGMASNRIDSKPSVPSVT